MNILDFVTLIRFKYNVKKGGKIVKKGKDNPMNTLKDVMQKYQNDMSFRQQLKKSKTQSELIKTLSQAGFELSPGDLSKFSQGVLGEDLDSKINK